MNQSFGARLPKWRVWGLSALTLIILLSAAVPAAAQLSRVGTSTAALYPGSSMRGSDASFDPENQVYLLVVGSGPIYGVFVNTSGQAVTAKFLISTGGFGSFPHVEYGPQVPNGVGGFGGFLVAWHNCANPNTVFSRLVSYEHPARVAGPVVQLSAGEQGGSWQESGPAIAYSVSSQRFLVSWRTMQFGVLGRFVGANGSPIGGVMSFEPAGGSRDPGLAWNSATNEFGLVTTGFNGSGAFAAFRRIRADGVISARTTFGFAAGTFATDIEVNASHQYVLVWAVHPGTRSAVFNQSGTLLTTNFVSSTIGFDQALGLSYNPTSGTFLVVSNIGTSREVAAMELKGSGVPSSAAMLSTNGANVGSFYPRASTNGSRWNIVYSRDFLGATDQIMATSSTGGAGAPLAVAGGGTTSPTPTTGCTTPDPFVAIGGGVCVNGGWLPKSTSGGSTSGGSTTGGCTTPDPFISMGGGVCVNGAWKPKSTTGGTGSTSGGCTTPDPFVSMGGGVCVNGGWQPKSTTGGTSCTTPDPFVSMGGGVCVNGGWHPKSTSTTFTCTIPDPFVSMGGGVCVNGAWLPKR